MASVAQDVRFALRAFRFNPVSAYTAALTLGLGIAATTSVLSIVDATLLRPLPFAASDRVVDVGSTVPSEPTGLTFGISRAQSEALRLSGSFESVAEYSPYPSQRGPVRIVGVVRDLREANERQAPGPSVYVPINAQSSEFFSTRTVVVRTSRMEPSLGKEIARALAGLDPRLSVTVARSDETLAERRQDPRFYAVFVGLAAGFGLLPAAVGIAAVPAQGVARRTKEIGVRLALGADVSGVIGLVVRQVCAPVVVGIGVGIAGALLAARVLKSFLYEISPQDPFTHVVAVGLLLGIALVAAFLPAPRAARINPVDALRAEQGRPGSRSCSLTDATVEDVEGAPGGIPQLLQDVRAGHLVWTTT
jgi:hypothetical protein